MIEPLGFREAFYFSMLKISVSAFFFVKDFSSIQLSSNNVALCAARKVFACN